MSFTVSGGERLFKQGLAAANSWVVSRSKTDLDEAEFFLDWALQSNLALDEQMEAWLWLSRIAQTEERKRECLENVLAIRPSHPDARRDMAVLEGRLKPEDMRADPWASGQAVGQGNGVVQGEARRFPCPKCGASLLFSPGMAALTCQFCGAKINEEGQIAGDAPTIGGITEDVSEQDWVKAIYTSTGHDWHLPQERVLNCEGCGAIVTFAPARISAKCIYCGSPYIVRAVPAQSSLREPDGVVPFALDLAAAGESVRAWLRESARKKGLPEDLASLAALHDLQPIYLPFWTFDFGGEVRWSGYVRDELTSAAAALQDTHYMVGMGVAFGALGLLVGHAELASDGLANAATVATGGGGEQKLTYTEGAVPVHLDDVTVPATASVASELVEGAKYDTKKALPYREEMLASWPAEVYTISMSDASLRARQAAIAETDKEVELLSGQVMGDEVSSLRKDRRGMTVVSYKLLLLPAWTAGYSYRGSVYKLLVNGQTGAVNGHLPKKEGTVSRLFGRRDN